MEESRKIWSITTFRNYQIYSQRELPSLATLSENATILIGRHKIVALFDVTWLR
jgi:hypothetical protein